VSGIGMGVLEVIGVFALVIGASSLVAFWPEIESHVLALRVRWLQRRLRARVWQMSGGRLVAYDKSAGWCHSDDGGRTWQDHRGGSISSIGGDGSR
jgi:hypothetical protein